MRRLITLVLVALVVRTIALFARSSAAAPNVPHKPRRTLKELKAITGGLSNPSKMPGYAYSLPARECPTGTKLRDVTGSVCHGCYAMKGRYVFPNVQAALYKRLTAIHSPEWVDAMVEYITLVTKPCTSTTCPLQETVGTHGHMRIHDSGDLVGVWYLEKWAQVARATPTIYYWMPTREYGMVREWLASVDGDVPHNLTIRLSAHMVGGHVPTFRQFAPVPTIVLSTVTIGPSPDGDAYNCPSRHQGNSCGDCRACWLPTVRRVNYVKH